MTRAQLTVVPREAAPADVDPPAEPLVHLRITGRHGVYLLQQGVDGARDAVVDTRAPEGIRCTCREAPGEECSHVHVLRACGFLPRVA